MKLRSNIKIISLLIISVIVFSLTGCLSSVSKKYSEYEAKAKSAYESSKSSISGTVNKTQTATKNTQGASKTSSATKKKSSVQQTAESEEAKFEHITYKSSAPASLRDATFRSHKGLYINPIKHTSFNKLVVTYTDLLKITDAKSTLDITKLKDGFNGKNYKNKGLADQKNQSWFYMLSQISASTLTSEKLKQYTCSEKALESKICDKLVNQKRIRWASMGSKFEAKRFFNEYLDNELDSLFKLASQAKHTVYLTRQTGITKYNFEYGGFMLTGVNLISANSNNSEHKKLSIFTGKKHGRNAYGVLYKMNESKAEKYTKILSENNYQLHYVYKVKFKIGKDSYVYKTKTLDVRAIKYDYDILSTHMQFYYDKALTRKAFELPIK